MLSISNDKFILKEVSHRPWPIPNRNWVWYQEWNEVVFLHWPVPIDWLKPRIPKSLKIDLFEGQSWISFVAFTMENVRPAYLPAFSPLSNFQELNIRTYVIADDKPGVYFLSIEAGKKSACWLADALSGLPYQFANMSRKDQLFQSHNVKTGNSFKAQYQVGNQVKGDGLDQWLTERYCLYQDFPNGTFRYEVHHQPWALHQVELKSWDIQYQGYHEIVTSLPQRYHFSPGVPILAFSKEKIN